MPVKSDLTVVRIVSTISVNLGILAMVVQVMNDEALY